ncbi:MAG TPA: porin [Candidatus Binatia bacterium]|nr:porin [Candidatus Binatia bacterium]
MSPRRLEWQLTSACLAVFVCALASSASARDLTEILTEKGLITPEEGAEAKATTTKPTVAYKEGLGFVFATPDKRFSLAVGGYLQVRYTLTDIDGRYVNPSRGTTDSQSFDVPRARLWWQGTAFTPRLYYKIEIDVATTASGDTLRDAYLGYAVVENDWLSIRGGQYKTNYSRQEMTSDARQEFVERALATLNFRFDRAKGIQLSGTPMNSLIEYYAGVFNTTGRNGPANPSNDFLYLGRFVVNPLGPIPYSEGDFGPTPSPLVALGASYGYERTPASSFTSAATAGPNPDDPTQTILTSTGTGINRVPYQLMIQPAYSRLQNPNDLTVGIQNFETDLAARWIGFDLSFEYFLGWNNTQFLRSVPPAPFVLPPSNFNSRGYYGQLGYFVIPKKVQLAARYSEITPNEKAEVRLFNGTTVTQRQSEMLGAVDYYFSEHNLKLQTDFGPLDSYGVRDAAGNTSNRHDFRWRVQAQLVF